MFNIVKASFLCVIFSSVVVSIPGSCHAQLLPVGDYNGQSFEQWGQDYLFWSIATDPVLGGMDLPDEVNGARYLPAFGSSNEVDVTVSAGTGLITTPFGFWGEIYDEGDPDSQTDPIIETFFEDAFIRIMHNGDTLLEGQANEFPDRLIPVFDFPEPITYVNPQPRGDRNATGAIFGTLIGSIFELPQGEHELVFEATSSFFGDSTVTYNVSVVPEPSSIFAIGFAATGLMMSRRRKC